MINCKRCKKPLKAPKSIALGYGPTCAKAEGIKLDMRRKKSKIPSHNIQEFIEVEENGTNIAH